MAHRSSARQNGHSPASRETFTTASSSRNQPTRRNLLTRGFDSARTWLLGSGHPEPTGASAWESSLPTRVKLGDFTADGRMVLISLLAIGIGVLGAFVAVALMGLIGLITNLAYYHRWSFKLVSPTSNTLGWWSVIIPVVGGLVIGFMARFGSERIRGHGIPEAMETILVGGSRIEPRLLLLKPLSSAISIGTGGPFGAEGPIILTGGALGSVISQFFKLSAAERKTLLVAGAAAGMAATFNAPVSSVLLAVELLVFELKPRSLVPIALASATATILRRHLIGASAMFPLGPHPTLDIDGLLASAGVGLAAGILSWLLTIGVYGAEDLFRKLPIHWMWWPALGGIAVGVGGVFFPRALGVGYDTIGDELAGRLTISVLVGIIVMKAVIWCLALGSGTSGGILAPLLLIGGALGGIEAGVLPGGSPGLWALIGMAAALSGVTRSPLTGVIFALELTYAVNVMLPLLVACVVAHMVTVLVLKRSILTEKVARRGFHVTREYAVDPLEVLAVREVMRSDLVTLAEDLPLTALRQQLSETASHGQRLYPVVTAEGSLAGVLTRTDIARLGHTSATGTPAVRDIMRSNAVVAYPDETLRVVAARMITDAVWRMPVVSRDNPRQIVGLISQRDLLRARQRLLEEERHRERVFRLRILAPRDERMAGRAAPARTVAPIPEPVAAPRAEQREVVEADAVRPEHGKNGAQPGSTVLEQRGFIANGDEQPDADDA
ncbi:MAG TPA: chloride channel protein [Ktedonobacterales bacterium]